MKLWHKIILLIFLLIICYYLFSNSHSIFKKAASITPSPTIITSVSLTTTPVQTTNTVLCHTNGILPDSSCTPGAIDPKVTQNNIDQTICVSGYTKTVRPPVFYTNSLKKQQIKDYGYVDKNLKDYEEDHLISLELGGNPTNPKNLWPEPGASPNPKDKIENLCHEKVCSRQINLEKAQQEIATNWPTACQ